MLFVFDYATACRCFPSEHFPLHDLQLCCSYRSLLSPDIQPCIDKSQSKHKNPIELRSIRCDRWACSCNPTTINRTHRNEKSFRKWVKLWQTIVSLNLRRIQFDRKQFLVRFVFGCWYFCCLLVVAVVIVIVDDFRDSSTRQISSVGSVYERSPNTLITFES